MLIIVMRFIKMNYKKYEINSPNVCKTNITDLILWTQHIVKLNYDKVHTDWRKEMKAEFTAIIEPAPEGGFWAICPEVQGANGQGETIDEAKDNLRQAIELILKDRREDILRGLPEDAIREKIVIA